MSLAHFHVCDHTHFWCIAPTEAALGFGEVRLRSGRSRLGDCFDVIRRRDWRIEPFCDWTVRMYWMGGDGRCGWTMIGEVGLARASQSSHPIMYLLTKTVLGFPNLPSLVAKIFGLSEVPSHVSAVWGRLICCRIFRQGTPIRINALSSASKSFRRQTSC